jgi:hypothetical protein
LKVILGAWHEGLMLRIVMKAAETRTIAMIRPTFFLSLFPPESCN